jgi:hypothetical protein
VKLQWSLREWLWFIGGAALMIVVIVGAMTFRDAWQAGLLPWQPEPTLVAVTSFANLPTPASTP